MIVMSIAGVDPSAGAGIFADLKTFQAIGVYGTGIVTALTAQNPYKFFSTQPIAPTYIEEQIDSVMDSYDVEFIKTGMLYSPEIIKLVSLKIKEYDLKAVVDPVMVATSGADLSNSESVKALKEKLIPLAALVTPNVPEAEVLSGMKINAEDDMKNAAEKINKECGCSVLIKGGHSEENANDVLYHDGEFYVFAMQKIDNENTHGTGCTLSSAIACNLAKGMDVPQAVTRAKEYITEAITAGLDLGHGRGPLDHGFDINTKFKNI